ncbi:MAG: divalent-cation tolerance protein CutA [Desulfobulbaceae bacterium]|nr:divalent-cation tolerance protein CutA [Desulfobulbaceae bacterium]HIJ89618.1 divalent-cation tolerance protein CutA [Deltaproteobacteria bacterium]
MNEYIQVATTVATEEEGGAIAGMLVEKRLAACVQVIGPMTSHYRWQGKIETAGEYLCLVKSRAALYPEIEAAIKSMHSYEVPEIVVMPVIAGSREYLAWLAAEVREPLR